MASSTESQRHAQSSQAELAARIYDERAASYDDSWHPAFVHDFLDVLRPPISPGEKILDLACGTGLVSFLAAARVGRHGRVLAVDVSERMLEQAAARQRAGYFPHVHFYKHNILHLDGLADVVKVKDEGGFDLITCASALVLLDNPSSALRYWTAFLKPCGRLLVDVPHPQDQPVGIIVERVSSTLDAVKLPWSRAWVRGPESLHAAFEQAGLEVQNINHIPQRSEQIRYITPTELLKQAECNFASFWLEQLAQSGLVDKAKQLFAQEAAAMADEEGRIMEVDGVYVGVAVKPPCLPTGADRARFLSPLPTTTIMQHVPEQPLYAGGCRCGAVKWSAFVQPKNSITYCHCSTCRRLSGAPFLVFLDFEIDAVKIEGTNCLQRLNITPYAERSYCRDCGSPMTMRYRKAPTTIGFTMGTLDDQGKQDLDLPWKHIMLKEKATWYKLPDDGVERCEGLSVSGLLDS